MKDQHKQIQHRNIEHLQLPVRLTHSQSETRGGANQSQQPAQVTPDTVKGFELLSSNHCLCLGSEGVATQDKYISLR